MLTWFWMRIAALLNEYPFQSSCCEWLRFNLCDSTAPSSDQRVKQQHSRWFKCEVAFQKYLEASSVSLAFRQTLRVMEELQKSFPPLRKTRRDQVLRKSTPHFPSCRLLAGWVEAYDPPCAPLCVPRCFLRDPSAQGTITPDPPAYRSPWWASAACSRTWAHGVFIDLLTRMQIFGWSTCVCVCVSLFIKTNSPWRGGKAGGIYLVQLCASADRHTFCVTVSDC